MSTNFHPGLHTPDEGVADARQIIEQAHREHPGWTPGRLMDYLHDVAGWLTTVDFADARKALPGWLAEQSHEAA